jgi:glucosamine--fructose-6-phosphate aminotransferase (isomerizing)
MCGIFGYVRSKGSLNKDPISVCIEGLSKLEYRGYDSAGIAGIHGGEIFTCKTVGKVAKLLQKIQENEYESDLAIAHTRWATHGRLTEQNAHPHIDQSGLMALVHNGIIENFGQLRKELEKEGIRFTSDTDSEVIVQLIAHHYKGDIVGAMQASLPLLRGSFAIVLIHKNDPTTLYTSVRNCPLVIGHLKESEQVFVASDIHAFEQSSIEIVFLDDDEIGIAKKEGVKIFNKEGNLIEKKFETVTLQTVKAQKNGFDHYMLKEIHEQPTTFKQSIQDRFEYDYGIAHFPELDDFPLKPNSIKHILILGCGTSWHAGCIAASMFESLVRIPSKCEIASEFRYTDPIISENTLVIAITQSGETADTLAAVREAKAKGGKVLGICNVERSTIVREADRTIFIKAGPEISVCSTKAFTSQLAVLSLLALYLARLHHMNKEQGKAFLDQIKRIPIIIEQILHKEKEIEKLALKYSRYENFIFLGRRYMVPTSLEAALKLKEISYINACAYPAGEMKHGPIALINPDFPVVAMCGNKQTLEKMISNMKEIEARNGPILAFAPEDEPQISEIAHDTFWMPSDIADELACIPYSVAAQLFAYFVAKARNTDIDQPRNLAKSVTVE